MLLNIPAVLAILVSTCDHFISLPLGFLTLDSYFHILGALVGSTSFVESFVVEVLREDLGTISNFLMLVNLQATFCDAFVVLCPMPRLFASYNVFISKYFIALC